MPVKWGPETDQILLLKILETAQVNADVKAISEAWPGHLDRPTPRAIQERLVKIRSQVKANGKGDIQFRVANAQKPASGSNITTPRKRKAPTNGTSSSSSKKSASSKYDTPKGGFAVANEDDDSVDEELPTPTKKFKREGTAKVQIKPEYDPLASDGLYDVSDDDHAHRTARGGSETGAVYV